MRSPSGMATYLTFGQSVRIVGRRAGQDAGRPVDGSWNEPWPGCRSAELCWSATTSMTSTTSGSSNWLVGSCGIAGCTDFGPRSSIEIVSKLVDSLLQVYDDDNLEDQR